MMNSRTGHLIKTAAGLYGFGVNSVKLINSDVYSPNDIYLFDLNDAEYILRIATHDADYFNQTAAEMEWLGFLHGRGISVSLPLPMRDGGLVNSIKYGDKYHAVCAFEKADGEECEKSDPNTWNDDVIYDYGLTMGRMHAATKDFKPSENRFTRKTFDGSDAFDNYDKLPQEIKKFADEFVPYLLSLPRTRETFGLIHNDFHLNNFFVDDNKVRVFDFDDSLYGYFALDLGIALHHAIGWNPRARPEKSQAEADKLINIFMRGYNSANALDDQTLKTIPLFMRYMQLCIFGWDYPEKNEPDAEYNLVNGLTMQGCRIDEKNFIDIK